MNSQTKTIKPIRNDKDYCNSLKKVQVLLNKEKGGKSDDELSILLVLIERYEYAAFLKEMPDPIEAIKFRIKQEGLKQKDLSKLLGTNSRVSEVLNKKRKLTLKMIRKLNSELRIPLEILIQEY